MGKISIIIPVYGQWNLAKRNIDSLLKFDTGLIAEIIVVDDCSPDPNPYHFNESLICIIRNEINLGYTATVNVGLKKASSSILFLLDSDAYLIKPVVADIIDVYENDPLLGCEGYKTVDDKGRRTGSFCYEPNALGLILGQQLEYKLEKFSLKTRNIMPYSCTASYRKKCLEEMGYFDQDQFPVLDADLDLAMRIHRSKWKLLFNEHILLSHSGGNSYKLNYKRVLMFYNSRWKLLSKHGLIKYPNLAKTLIKARLGLELLVLTFICFCKKNDKHMQEKKNGRKVIIKEVSSYKIYPKVECLGTKKKK